MPKRKFKLFWHWTLSVCLVFASIVLLIWQHGCGRWKGSRFVWWSTSHKVSGRGNLNIFLLKTVLDCESPLGAGSRIFLIIIEHLFCILWDCAVHIDPALKSAIFMTSYIRLTSWCDQCGFREVTTKTHLYCIVKAYVWPTSHTDVQAHGQGAALERSMKPPEDRRILHLVKHT